MISPVYLDWAEKAVAYFVGLGAAKTAAKKFALLYVLAWAAGTNPRIVRIYTDPARQAELRAAWDSGNRAGLRVRPADASKHTVQDFWRRPASMAMDMPSDNDRAVAVIARSIGLGVGEAFSVPDPGHYFVA